jgi:hypothetical protein
VQHDTGHGLRCPEGQILTGKGENFGLDYHRYYALMVWGLAYFFKFLIFADFIGAFAFRKFFAERREFIEVFRTKKKSVYRFRMYFRKSAYRIKAANGQLVY